MNWKIASSSMFKTHKAGFSLIELLVVLVLVQMVGLNAWAWREKMQQHRHQTALKEQLLKTFATVARPAKHQIGRAHV